MVVRELVTVLGFRVDQKNINTFNKSTDATKTKFSKMSVLWRKFRIDNNKLLSGFKGLGSKFGEVVNQVPGLSRLAGIFGSTAPQVAAVTAAVGALVIGLVQATKLFIEFEKGLKGVERVTLANKEEMARLKQAALEAGEASIFTTADAANAMKFLAQAGLNVDQTIAALPKTLQLAAAADIDLAAAADIVTNIMAANKIAIEDLSIVNDQLVKTQSRTNTNIMELGEAFKTLGATGHLANVSLGELNSLFGVLANNGIKGSLAGTLLRNAFEEMRNPSDELIASFKKAGINLENFIDDAGRFKDFSGLLREIEKLDAVSKNVFFNTGFSQSSRGKRALEIFTSGNVDLLRSINNEVVNSFGTAEKASQIAFKGLSGAVALFGSRMEASSNRFFEESGFAGLFEDIVRVAADVLPPLIITLGRLISPFIKSLRFVSIILRVIGKIIGFVTKVFNQLFDLMTDDMQKAFQNIFDGFSFLLTQMDTFFSFIEKNMGGFLEFIANIIKGFFSAINFIFVAINKIAELIQKIPIFQEKDPEKNVKATTDSIDKTLNNIKTTNLTFNNDITFSGTSPNNKQQIEKSIQRSAQAIFQIELQRILRSTS